MPDSSYIPARESELVTFATTFNTKIVATPLVYGLLASQSTAFTALFNAFHAAYLLAKDEATRSPVNITAKDNAKEAMINGPGGIRQLAGIIQSYPAITDELLQGLGLTVRDRQPTPIPAPTVAPEIDFVPSATRTIRVRLHNDKTLNRRKPEGVTGATLFYFVGAEAPVELKDWTFCTNSTRTNIEINPPAEVPDGATVWFTGFWRNPRDMAGPCTTPVSTKVQWGGLASAG